MGGWREVEHTADLALHLWGAALEDLFRTAAAGLRALVLGDAEQDTVRRPGTAPGHTDRSERVIALDAPDAETLLVDWLNELLYLLDVPGLAWGAVRFAELTERRLRATVETAPAPPPRVYIKAATFHKLEITRTPQGLETEIVFDT